MRSSPSEGLNTVKKVEDIMSKDVVIVNPEAPVAVAAKRMLEESIGCLVVIDNGVIKGIVTDRDLLVCAAQGHNIQKCSISNHMTSPVVTAPPETPLLRLAKLMTGRRIKRVPITNRRELVGIVSFSDIARDMDQQVAGMWSEWLDLVTITKTSTGHRRGRRVDKSIQTGDNLIYSVGGLPAVT